MKCACFLRCLIEETQRRTTLVKVVRRNLASPWDKLSQGGEDAAPLVWVCSRQKIRGGTLFVFVLHRQSDGQ